MARIYVDTVSADASEGARLLWGVVQRVGSQSALAVRLGASKSCVNVWLRGKQKPNAASRVALRRYGIPLTAWERVPVTPFALPGHGS